MDRGIWATWYDLPAEGAGAYLAWLHETHIPAMLRRPGYLWAAHVRNVMSPEREAANARRLTHVSDPSVLAGNAYLMLYGAANPHTFLDPSPAEMLAAADAETVSTLGQRIAARSCVFVEVERVDGAEVKSRAPGITPGPVIQLGTFNINRLENEAEMGTWYTRSRLPLLLNQPGSVGARKLVSIDGWAKHAILYEFTSLEAARGNLRDLSDWSNRVVDSLVHAPHSPSLGERIWPA